MSNIKYNSLNDAAFNPEVRSEHQNVLQSPPDPDGPRIEVWYCKDIASLSNTPFVPDGDEATHINLGEIQYRHNWQSLFYVLQGESWSPKGEASDLIKSKGLTHTSFSVGDVLVIHHSDGQIEKWMCSPSGWMQK